MPVSARILPETALEFRQSGADGNDACAIVLFHCYNGSGADSAAGDVVIKQLTSAFTVDRISYTTDTGGNSTAGLGMAYETITSTSVGRVQVQGPTTALKVDGTTDIAIGDYIGTFTTAKIGQKSTTADARMAIALEAYTANDSLGVVDAFLICGALVPF